jgi:hypothetical protein
VNNPRYTHFLSVHVLASWLCLSSVGAAAADARQQPHHWAGTIAVARVASGVQSCWTMLQEPSENFKTLSDLFKETRRQRKKHDGDVRIPDLAITRSRPDRAQSVLLDSAGRCGRLGLAPRPARALCAIRDAARHLPKAIGAPHQARRDAVKSSGFCCTFARLSGDNFAQCRGVAIFLPAGLHDETTSLGCLKMHEFDNHLFR